MNDIIHSSYHDLHTNMIASNPRPNNNPHSLDPLDRRPSLLVRQNFASDVGRNIYDSVSHNTAFIAVAILKIITSASILLFSTNTCNKPLHEFLIYMMVHDFLYCVILFLKLLVTLSAYEMQNNLQEPDLELGPRHSPHSGSRRSSLSEPEYGVYHRFPNTHQEGLERRNRILTGLSMLVNIYYYLLFIYGQVLYFQPDSNCAAVAPALNGLTFTYICFGYIYIGIPIVFVLVACLCLPFVLICLYFFNKGDQVPAKKDLIKKLPVLTYTSDFPGNPECSICMVEYKEGEKVIQLKCSPLHYYHEECLKKWLSINGLCPICRKRIDEDDGVELKERQSNTRATQ